MKVVLFTEKLKDQFTTDTEIYLGYHHSLSWPNIISTGWFSAGSMISFNIQIHTFLFFTFSNVDNVHVYVFFHIFKGINGTFTLEALNEDNSVSQWFRVSPSTGINEAVVSLTTLQRINYETTTQLTVKVCYTVINLRCWREVRKHFIFTASDAPLLQLSPIFSHFVSLTLLVSWDFTTT